MGRGAYFASQSCKGHHGLPFPKWQTELARSAMQTCPWCFGVVNGSTFAAGVMAGRSGWYPLSCTSSPEGQLFNSGVLQTSGRCCRQRFNRLAGVHVPLFRIRIVCFVSPSTAVLVSSCNAKEPHHRPILFPASDRKLHVSREVGHCQSNMKSHVQANSTKVAAQEHASPSDCPPQ